ncbi:MAG TPA: hypothetical protein DHU55_03250 [Blastocatellia bacterium]|nr:hypothetical protein [Blastocatellia bacterium]
MKLVCAKCGSKLLSCDEAYICSYECTFWSKCTAER